MGESTQAGSKQPLPCLRAARTEPDTYGLGTQSALRAKALEPDCLAVNLAGFVALENNPRQRH